MPPLALPGRFVQVRGPAVIPLAAMRSLWYVPLAFLAGAHGFAIFAPYLAVVFAALHLRSRARARALAVAALVPIPA